jgi:hypothetical protein
MSPQIYVELLADESATIKLLMPIKSCTVPVS